MHWRRLCRRFLLSPLVKWSLVAAGGAMVVHWVVKEARRINEELERARRAGARFGSRNSADFAARSFDRRIPAESLASFLCWRSARRKTAQSNTIPTSSNATIGHSCGDCFFPAWSWV